MKATPYEQIQQELKKKLPATLLSKLPKKWEKLGDIIILTLSDSLHEYKNIIGKTYASILGGTSVLEDKGGIQGEYRQPTVSHIYGSTETETEHKENDVRYLLDPQKVMFSSGNMSERIRMATIADASETIVDLFAGIGYFTLPIAVHSTPKKLIAVELNPVAFSYLKKNIVLNHVTDIVEPVLGDNRQVAPDGVADRVIIGYLGNTSAYLPVAMRCLKPEGGIIHYHDVVPIEVMKYRPMQALRSTAVPHGFKVKLKEFHVVKSYAPGINHVVLDGEVTPR